MRSDLVHRLQSTVDVYAPVVTVNNVTNETTIGYALDRHDHAHVVVSPTGLSVTTYEPVRPLSRMSNILDPDGTPLSPHKFLYVVDSSPEMDFSGRVYAWRHSLKRALPRDFVQQIQEYTDSVDSPAIDTSAGHG